MHQYQLKKTKEISKIICNQCGRDQCHKWKTRRKKFFVWNIHGAIFLKGRGESSI